MTRLTEDWVTAGGPQAVLAALGGQGFFVGGCVRNALLNAPVADIDIATPLVPDDVTVRLKAAGIKVVPTGLQHGTVTAVPHGEGIEVTTFRADIQTDGRHAVVSFTTDIASDAARRDFTMNALYADSEGTVIDPLGGLADLLARRVRFINRAGDRIREDYLRILRFFRFHAWYGADGIDADGLSACAALADGLDQLARERVGWEFRKLLAAPDPAPAVASMAAAGILARCLPGAASDGLAPLVHAEQTFGRPPDWITRLKVLGGEEQTDRLRLSGAEARALDLLGAALGEDRPAVATYLHGREAAERANLIRASSTGENPEAGSAQIAHGAAQSFPLKANDLIEAGFTPGPDLGAALKAAEALWIDSQFQLDKQTLLGHVASNRS